MQAARPRGYRTVQLSAALLLQALPLAILPSVERCLRRQRHLTTVASPQMPPQALAATLLRDATLTLDETLFHVVE
jgi:hypothetical protein